MNYFGFEDKAGVPAKGKLLIAGPFLGDPSFARSVVLICEHTPDGSIGFVLNHLLSATLADLADGLESGMPVALYQGGPVEKNTLHILHRLPNVLGGVQVTDTIYWGGSYEKVLELARNNQFDEHNIRLFIGYSGWGEGQLDGEMEEHSWLVGTATDQLVFHTEPHLMWKAAITGMGQQFAYLANTPINPQLN
ncbi:MAG: YqgE/AlgH family protein [Chitinophagia bacterium]|nr:YqgE/AlgH family protein [Chitinophagia bacterium]